MDRKNQSERFNDYEGFVEKFKPKKTTDDCYTPEPIYDIVLAYARKHFPVGGRSVVRPFWPGGDYENFDYPENCVVIDNPPFSIVTKVVRWYCSRGIDFFLFCPGLTAFIAQECDLTYVIINEVIRYANGAKVNTAFVTNLRSIHRIIIDPDLSRSIKKAQTEDRRKNAKAVRTRTYSPHMVTSALLRRYAHADIPTVIPKFSAAPYPMGHRDGIFGNAFLISSRAVDVLKDADRNISERMERERMERERMERERMERERMERERTELPAEAQTIVEGLDQTDRDIIAPLDAYKARLTS